MTDSAHIVTNDGSVLIGAHLSMIHGWAWSQHTDGTLELRRSRPIDACPECDQDRALGRVDPAPRHPA
jgi:hypothetical protein